MVPTRAKRAARRALVLGGGLLLALGAASPQAVGVAKLIRTQVANYEKTPIALVSARVKLRESFTPPNQVPLSALAGVPKSKPARGGVRYLNRLAQQVPIYQLEGELEISNTTPKRVKLVQVTAVYFDAFRMRLGDERRTLRQLLAPAQRARLSWLGELPHEDVFEMFFVVTGARFDDDTTWTAPEEELVLEP